MACIAMTKKERNLHECACMILHDQCPPDRNHYLCMVSEDDTALDCTQCWDNYLWGVVEGTIELPSRRKGATA